MGALYVMLKAKDFRLGKIDSLAYTGKSVSLYIHPIEPSDYIRFKYSHVELLGL